MLASVITQWLVFIATENVSMKKITLKKLKRLLLKFVWFGVVSVIVFVIGMVIFLTLLALNESTASDKSPELSTGDLVVSTVLASVALIAVLGLVVFITRRSKKTFLRWTKKSLIVLIPLVLITMVLTVLSINSQDTGTTQQVSSAGGLAGQQSYVEGQDFNIDKLLAYTNEERVKNDKSPLTLSSKLNESSLNKCKDMVSNNYWSHNDSEGREPWRFIVATGYQYENAGENLAYGFSSESAVTTGWMNSESHKKNLLDNYKEVGFGVCVSDNYVSYGKQLIVVQHFATPGKVSSPTQQNDQNTTTTTKPYVASVCTRTTIPFETVYVDASYLYVGESQGYGGWDGYKETCTADSTGYKPADYTSQPYNRTVYRGTKPKPSNTAPTPPTGSSPSPSCVPDGQGGYQC